MISFDENRYYTIQSAPLPEYPQEESYSISEEDKLDEETLKIPEGFKRLPRLCGFLMKNTPSNSANGIKTVILPSTMELIDSNAFAGTDVETIKFNNSLKYIFPSAFHYEHYFYSKIREIDLPDSLKYIGSSCFAYLPYLKKAKLGKNIEIITYNAFAYCPELEEVILPEGVKLIQKAAFYNCPKLSKINLPKSIQWIDKEAFTGTKINLQDFNFPFLKDGFAVRGENDSLAEYYYGNEETVTVPSYIKTIGAECFANTNVKRVILGENVTKIKPAAFINTKKLETVVLNKNIKLIPKRCFQDSSIQHIEGDLSGLRCIGNSAFASSEIKAFHFPKDFETICGSAFDLCRKLTDVSIEEDIKEIRGKAFSDCTNLNTSFISKIDSHKVHPSAFEFFNTPNVKHESPFPSGTVFKTEESLQDYEWRPEIKKSFVENSMLYSPGLDSFYDNYEAYRVRQIGFKTLDDIEDDFPEDMPF